MPPDDKDAAVFPRRFGGRWVLLHRPFASYPTAKANIWLTYSPDLKHWGDHCVLLEARRGAWWDANKIGLSPPPIETPEGWLIIYHGVRETPAGCLYRLGLALLDLEDPCRVVLRGDEWIFGPDEPYERAGDVSDVVFPCGVIHTTILCHLFRSKKCSTPRAPLFSRSFAGCGHTALTNNKVRSGKAWTEGTPLPMGKKQLSLFGYLDS